MFRRITASSSGGACFKHTETPLKTLKVLKALNTVVQLSISACDVKIVFCGQLRTVLSVFKTSKVFNGVFVFLKQYPVRMML
jgi:hypothetical protein